MKADNTAYMMKIYPMADTKIGRFLLFLEEIRYTFRQNVHGRDCAACSFIAAGFSEKCRF